MRLPNAVWTADLGHGPHQPDWIWDGLLAKGSLTLLTSLWKSGKTTLVSLLLERRRQGGILLGKNVAPGKTIVVTEESEQLWASRRRRLDFGAGVGFFFRPFDGRPDLAVWRALIDRLLDLHTTHGVDLVVIDPLAYFLPADENNAASVFKALSEVQRLTEAGIAVLLLHHPPKGQPAIGQAARGSGALPAFADILIEMRIPPGDSITRRRRLHAFSRYTETPPCLYVELNLLGTDYTVLPDDAADDPPGLALHTLLGLLEQAPAPLTREEIRQAWPDEPPPRHTLWRWLTRACAMGLVAQTGSGNKGQPFRYRLADQKEEDIAMSA